MNNVPISITEYFVDDCFPESNTTFYSDINHQIYLEFMDIDGLSEQEPYLYSNYVFARVYEYASWNFLTYCDENHKLRFQLENPNPSHEINIREDFLHRIMSEVYLKYYLPFIKYFKENHDRYKLVDNIRIPSPINWHDPSSDVRSILESSDYVDDSTKVTINDLLRNWLIHEQARAHDVVWKNIEYLNGRGNKNDLINIGFPKSDKYLCPDISVSLLYRALYHRWYCLALFDLAEEQLKKDLPCWPKKRYEKTNKIIKLFLSHIVDNPLMAGMKNINANLFVTENILGSIKSKSTPPEGMSYKTFKDREDRLPNSERCLRDRETYGRMILPSRNKSDILKMDFPELNDYLSAESDTIEFWFGKKRDEYAENEERDKGTFKKYVNKLHWLDVVLIGRINAVKVPDDSIADIIGWKPDDRKGIEKLITSRMCLDYIEQLAVYFDKNDKKYQEAEIYFV